MRCDSCVTLLLTSSILQHANNNYSWASKSKPCSTCRLHAVTVTWKWTLEIIFSCAWKTQPWQCRGRKLHHQPPASSRQRADMDTPRSTIAAWKGPARRLGRWPSWCCVCWPLVLWRFSTVLPIKETFFNSWSMFAVRGLVYANGLSAGSCLRGEVEGIWDLVLAQQGCGTIGRDGSCSKLSLVSLYHSRSWQLGCLLKTVIELEVLQIGLSLILVYCAWHPFTSLSGKWDCLNIQSLKWR